MNYTELYPTLYDLIKTQNYQEFDKLLSENPVNLNQGRVNLKYDEYVAHENLLCLAIKRSNLNILQTVLKHGANPNYQEVDRHMNKSYSPAFNIFTTYIYPERQRKDMLELLVQYGLNVNIITSMQDSLLLQSVRMYCQDNINDLSVLNYLLEQGAFINHNRGGESALSIAVEYKNEALAHHLIDCGANAKLKHIKYRAKNGDNLAINILNYYEAIEEKQKLENSVNPEVPSSHKIKI